MVRIAFALIFAGLLAGCNSTLHVEKPDPTSGLYATHTVLKPADVRVAEKFDPAYTEMVYLKVNAETPNPRFVDFFVAAFKEMHTFKKIVTKDDLQAIVIERNLGSKVPSVSDLVGLNNLSKEIGPFLIVEPNAVFKGGYNFEGTLKATDASTGKTVLLIDMNAFNMAGLDDPLFHPMLNGFINWTRNQPVTPEMPTTAQQSSPAKL
ncbi:hypothetical protein NDK50_10100 [Paraburkholderia bryophila]|jgi:hypothetical protein|uniref:Lipoprotein n=1 Tax=Paraburkholderia bryophila TaxID=420952 RepID=A0A329BGZ2_9BURK|nr:hypothetical protein [Paraburkholderia bryophila]RAS20930.1 hypothetical protein BX591_1325 [Paraburkholderia bryophila]WCM21771.1 hypothetical protein NDK50_10100 [Paraburkholderia bryophila]